MTTMISEVYEAFKEANISDETARKAAEAVVAYDSRFVSLELRMEKLDGKFRMMLWLQNVVVGGVITILIKLFFQG